MKKIIAVMAAVILGSVLTVRADEAKPVELKGKIGCSACTYQVADKCGVSFKTDDGKIYTLESPSKELMKARHSDGTIKVTGIVAEKDGKLFVKASKAELEK